MNSKHAKLQGLVLVTPISSVSKNAKEQKECYQKEYPGIKFYIVTDTQNYERMQYIYAERKYYKVREIKRCQDTVNTFLAKYTEIEKKYKQLMENEWAILKTNYKEAKERLKTLTEEVAA